MPWIAARLEAARLPRGKGTPGRVGASGRHTGSGSQRGSEMSGNNNNNSDLFPQLSNYGLAVY